MDKLSMPNGVLSRRCVVCKQLEQPDAGWIVSSFWFCPDCAAKIEMEFRNRKETKRIEECAAAEDS